MPVATRAVGLAFAFAFVVAPLASALPGEPYAVSATYRLVNGPLALVAGDLEIDARATGIVAAAVSAGTVLARIPELEVLDGRASPPARVTFRDVDVVIASGGLFVDRGGAPALAVRTDPAYGVALVPPLSAEGDSNVAGIVLASVAARHRLAVPGGATTILPLDAVVTIRDPATGVPVKDWDARRVNAGVAPDAAARPADAPVELVARGAFEGTIVADVALVPLSTSGGALDADVRVAPAGDPRLDEAFDALAADSGGLDVPAEALDGFRALAPLLNGAVVLVLSGDDGVEPAITAAGATRAVGAFTLLRGEALTLSLEDTDTARLTGEARLMLAEDGFVTQGRAAVAGVFPVVAVVLWVVAIGLVVARFVRKPTAREVEPGLWKWVGRGAHVAMLAVAFLIFDASFAHAFGSSVVQLLLAGGADVRTLGTIAAFEILPFTLAGFAFAMPVRLAVGVGLRYTGRGKGWKGYAKAAGDVALAVFTPAYALFFLNATIVRLLTSAIAGAA